LLDEKNKEESNQPEKKQPQEPTSKEQIPQDKKDNSGEAEREVKI